MGDNLDHEQKEYSKIDGKKDQKKQSMITLMLMKRNSKKKDTKAMLYHLDNKQKEI